MTPIRAFEVSLGIYTLRLATADEADVLARHRASMFRDMGEIDEQGASIIENASQDHLAALIEAREYFGFLVEHESDVVGHASKEGRPLYEDLGFEDSNEMRIKLT